MTSSEKAGELAIEDEYRQRFEMALKPAEAALEAFLRDHLAGLPRIDRISVRAKSVARFVQKALKTEGGEPKYTDPMAQIQDQLGARIVTFYLDDVERVAERIRKYLVAIEMKDIVPDNEAEFGYFGRHFILLTPSDVLVKIEHEDRLPRFFELQIKTLYQHAWAEANHDLAYKPLQELTSDQKRMIAFTAAQSWGADQMFENLRRDLVAV